MKPAPLAWAAPYDGLNAATMPMNMMDQVILANVIGPIRIIGSVGPLSCSANARATPIAHALIADQRECSGSSMVAPTRPSPRLKNRVGLLGPSLPSPLLLFTVAIVGRVRALVTTS